MAPSPGWLQRHALWPVVRLQDAGCRLSLALDVQVMMGAVVTSKADVYSLGLVLWEICTQERPQRGQNRDLGRVCCC